VKPTSDLLKRIAHLRFKRAKRWLTQSDPSSFNAYVALCEALFWRNHAERTASKERIVQARERSARIEAAMKDTNDA